MKRCTIILILTFGIISFNLFGQETNINQPQKKIALVIGNGNYVSGMPLANPGNDARAMKVALQNVGFTVMEYENLNQSQMKIAIDEFGDNLKSNDVGLFFYAGHGIQTKGYNYLIPIDAELKSEQQVEYDCVQADRVLARMEASGAKVNIIILDACRNNPFERTWTRSTNGKGLAFMNAPSGTLIAYATSPGSTASDGSGNNGLYTSAILESIKTPNITILEMFQNVRKIVSQKSNNQQIPWESTSLIGNIYLNTGEVFESEISNEKEESYFVKPTSQIIVQQGIEYIYDARDRQVYETIKIGEQNWMAVNLKATILNDSTIIPMVTDNFKWSMLTSPGYCLYENKSKYIDTYGILYNWYAINSGKLCPLGWHVPTNEDWSDLNSYLNGENVAGGKLKETGKTHWKKSSSFSSNETGFTALPGGRRFGNGYTNNKVNANGVFYGIEIEGSWWSATEVDSIHSLTQSMYYLSQVVRLEKEVKSSGVSVRCIKD